MSGGSLGDKTRPDGQVPGALDKARTARSAGLLGLGMSAARGLGLVRDILIANALGTGHVAEAWLVAFRIPNLLGFHLATGAFNPVFVPVLNEYLERRGRAETRHLVSAATTAFALLLLAAMVLGMVFAAGIVRISAWGFAEVPGKIEFTAHLMRWCFTYLFMVGLGTIFLAILQSLNDFRSSALAPVVTNIVVIASILFVCPRFGETDEQWVRGLIVGTVLAGVAQVAVHVPGLIRQGMLPRWLLDLGHPGVRKMFRLMPPTLLGVGVTQLSILTTTFLASFLAPGALASLEYATRVVQFPYVICASAFTAAVLPVLSRQSARGDTEGFRRMLDQTLRATVFLMLPVSALFSVLSAEIARLLFERGAFSAESTLTTATALSFVSPIMVTDSLLRILIISFFARQDTRTPVRVAVVTYVATVIMAVVLMSPLGIRGLAIALAAAPLLGAVSLIVVSGRTLGYSVFSEWRRTLLATGFGTLAACAIAVTLRAWLTGALGSTSELVREIVVVTVPGGLGVGTFVSVAWLLQTPEIEFVVRTFLRRKHSGPIEPHDEH